METEINLSELEKKFQEEEKRGDEIPLKHRRVEKIEDKDVFLGYKLFLGPHPGERKGLRWLVFLKDNDPSTISILRSSDPRYITWPDDVQIMVLGSEKFWESGAFKKNL